ncbi:MAG TPA: phosphoribosylamine--glycine ligase [candidate division Zixibacteria bacterium]|jgi:phosphoribosylamine--glycine ligase
MRKIRVLIIGGGGREHALCWAVAQSRQVEQVFCAPGNAGIRDVAQIIDISATDIPSLISLAERETIDLTIVGPEAPLAAGIVDDFRRHGLRIFGPTMAAARLESSKVFAKEFMRRHFIPTAPFQVFDNPDEALKFIAAAERSLVVKADGLAAGKGVFVCRDSGEARAAVETIMVKRAFGDAGNRIVIERVLDGEEMSVMAITDGERLELLVPARDYKRLYDGDRGPNTGGMGSYAPSRPLDDELLAEVKETILEPTLAALKAEGFPYSGVLYAGLMVSEAGPRVLEFNCRFGDPEAQAVLPLLKTDIVDVIGAAMAGRLDAEPLAWRDEYCVCVVLAARGYPGAPDKGVPIEGKVSTQNGGSSFCFHAGTVRDANGMLVTDGGRLLGMVARSDTHEAAVAAAYAALEGVRVKGGHFRTDIGVRSGTFAARRRPDARRRRR